MKTSLLAFFFLLPLVLADLRVGFYNATCPQAESIIRQVVQKRFATDSSVTGALLRMHFHDCFVRGCDASILIDSTPKKPSEKSAGPNLTVRGFELIDEAKKSLEAACPSTVSCADIITLATRDSVVLAGGPSYAAPTGRRDGLVSNPDDVNLPGPSFSVSQALQAFTANGLTLNDMVPTTFLDQNTSSTFDNQYYNQLRLKRGILQIDQELASDRSTTGIVSGFASNGVRFSRSFATAIIKMGSLQVLVGNAGEIRKNCRVFNLE